MVQKLSKWHIFVLVIVLAFLLMVLNNGYLFRVDEQSIVKVIQSIDGYEYEQIEILDIKKIEDELFVGFLSNDQPAYIRFIKNEFGLYEMRNIEKRMDESFSMFAIPENDVLRLMYVTNNQNEIARMELKVNDHVIQKNFSVKESSVSWIELPKGSYNFNYKFFNKEGHLIDN